MIEIKAYQHIYANVEKDRSPKGRGGFQTLFYTHAGLNDEEVGEIEPYILYYPSEAQPIKKTYFTLPTGKFVISHIVPLTGTDSAGRTGRYFSHSLVFDKSEAKKFDFDPFLIFSQFNFITDTQIALKQGDFESGDIPQITIEIAKKSDFQEAKQWKPADLKKLILLGLNVPRMDKDQQAVAFTGMPDEVFPAIKALFFAVPLKYRQLCTFDTYFYKCNFVATPYWGVGLLEPTANPRFSIVNATTLSVELAFYESPKTCYEHWVFNQIDENNFSQIDRDKDLALELGNFLDETEFDEKLLDQLSTELIKSVFSANEDQVKLRVLNTILKVMPEELTQRIFDKIYLENTPEKLLHFLRKGFEPDQLLEILHQVYRKASFEEPSKTEKKALKETLKKYQNTDLSLILLCWNKNYKELSDVLLGLKSAEYAKFVEKALKFDIIESADRLYVAKGTETLLESYFKIRSSQSRDDAVDLVKILLEKDEYDHFGIIEKNVATLTEKELRKLNKMEEELPAYLFRAIKEQAEKLPKQSIIGKIKGLVGLN